MNSVIDQLYRGPRFQWETIVSTDPDYWPMTKQFGERRQQFEDRLAPDDKAEYEKLHDMDCTLDSMDYFAHYTAGFRAGAQLMMEVLLDINPSAKEGK